VSHDSYPRRLPGIGHGVVQQSMVKWNNSWAELTSGTVKTPLHLFFMYIEKSCQEYFAVY